MTAVGVAVVGVKLGVAVVGATLGVAVVGAMVGAEDGALVGVAVLDSQAEPAGAPGSALREHIPDVHVVDASPPLYAVLMR